MTNGSSNPVRRQVSPLRTVANMSGPLRVIMTSIFPLLVAGLGFVNSWECIGAYFQFRSASQHVLLSHVLDATLRRSAVYPDRSGS